MDALISVTYFLFVILVMLALLNLVLSVVLVILKGTVCYLERHYNLHEETPEHKK